ncbi:MAG TPA: lasso peptide biosynthesis B2 protein [Bryobacteraceae bacterium]|nr:lasso peptide biosynthesis B2 protein [Bryobacteraceae bacterium]
MLAQALTAVAMTRVALWAVPLALVRRSVRWLLSAEHPLARRRRCPQDQVIRAVASAGKHCPVGSTCLATALVGQALLERHGYRAQLRLGARRKPDGAFTAHAWLEQNGRVILGGPAAVVDSYTRFPEMEHLIR